MKQHPKFKNIKVTEDGQIWSEFTQNYLKPRENSNGYLIVYVKDIKKDYRVHRLVAETYLPDSEHYGLDVNHKNGIKTDNRLVNLEWCTRSQNILHAHDTGLNNCNTENHHGAVYTNDQIHLVCQMLQDGARNIDIANKYGINKDVIAQIRGGSLWRRISCQYTFEVKRNRRASVKTVEKVCELLEKGLTPIEVSRNLKSSAISYKDIVRIRSGETWRSVSCKYNIPKSNSLKECDVREICSLLCSGQTPTQISKTTRYTFDQVYKIAKRNTWVDVSRDYDF